MNMISVLSTNISAIGYDEEAFTLRIIFKSGVYDYHGVPKNVFDNFLSSPSKGKFFVKFIKHRYSSIKIA